MNLRWEGYISKNSKAGALGLKDYIKEYNPDLDKILDIANVNGDYETAYLITTVKELKEEVKKLKKKTKKVIDDE